VFKTKGGIGIFGGTFNPVNLGHLLVAHQILEKFKLDQIFFIPVYLPPLKSSREVISARHRLRMTRLAIDQYPGFKISSLEIARRGKSYAFDTIKALAKKYSQKQLFFITGADSVATLHQWHRIAELLELCDFMVVPRPGHDFPPKNFPAQRQLKPALLRHICFVPIKVLDISSREIRRLLRKKKDISCLVPKPIAEYIKKHKLYR
jgi:nicotinate-nucleotide adenylyltransferase